MRQVQGEKKIERLGETKGGRERTRGNERDREREKKRKRKRGYA